MELNIYVPRNKEDSKCWQVFSPFSLGWDDETHIEHDYQYRGGVGMFWGLVGQNSMMIKEYHNTFNPYIFSDMPYFGRWNGLKEAVDPDAEFYWRVCIRGMHTRFRKSDANGIFSDRFDKHNIPIREQKRRGDEIILCPSSASVTRHLCNCSVDGWIEYVTKELRKYTDRPIRVRHKPRGNGTSGPSVATVPFEEDMRNAYAVITNISMSSAEALCHGVPIMETSEQGFTNYAFRPENIEELEWSGDGAQRIMNWLAYQQFTPKEMHSGEAREILRGLHSHHFYTMDIIGV